MNGANSSVIDWIALQDVTGGSTTDRLNAPVNSDEDVDIYPGQSREAAIPLIVRREATTGSVIRQDDANLVNRGRSHTQPGKPKLILSGKGKLRLKKTSSGQSDELESPPTPWGCEWRQVDDGWNLWRYWTEKDPAGGERIRKERYLGSLSREAWNVLKGYDNETIISNIGQRFRRHGRG